jgi:hypothetical protein
LECLRGFGAERRLLRFGTTLIVVPIAAFGALLAIMYFDPLAV